MARIFPRALLLVSLVACGDDGGPPADAGEPDADLSCARDGDCQDGTFCNGTERCLPGDPAADTRGCVAATGEPCPAPLTCDEDADRCATDCDVEPDADGDGHDAMDCGGDDCDDADGNAYPGNPEVCDSEGHDEDCNPDTLAGATEDDRDGDGFTFVMCCNRQMDATLRCGLDCDDSAIGINPTSAEICDGLDNDCNGFLDFPGEDNDGDGFADCTDLPDSIRDCDDGDNSIYPGAAELCDDRDTDCDGTQEDVDDDGGAATTDVCLECAGPTCIPKDDCDDDDLLTRTGFAELCGGGDEDCDGMTDEEPQASADCLGMCVSGCSTSSTTIECVGGSCEVTACPPGLTECDGDVTVACETDTANDPRHCNGCSMGCPFACADSACDPAVAVLTGGEGGGFGCATTASGRVACWGSNARGQLATGSVGGERATPTSSLLNDVGDWGAGYWTACAAVDVAGTAIARCWGDNGAGGVGTGTVGGYVGTPTDVMEAVGLPLGAVRSIDAAPTHSCAVATDGTTYCWGNPCENRIGYGSCGIAEPFAQPVPDVPLADEVATGNIHTCIRSGGSVRCWGSNGFGKSGVTPPGGLVVPAASVEVITDAVELDAGRERTCVRRTSGRVACWGLGIDGTTDATPRDIMGFGDTTNPAVALTVGDNHVCVVLAMGEARCAGANTDGQLGDGSMVNRSAPVDVRLAGGASLDDAVAIAGGLWHTCAVRTDGSVVCWGNGNNFRLGNGSAARQLFATPVSLFLL